MDRVYRGWVGGRGEGWAVGAGGEPKAGYTIHKPRQTAAVCPQWGTETATVDMVGRDGRWQQPDTPCSLISAPQWPHAPCSGPTWFSRVGKRPPVKADLDIYSPVNGVYV